MDQFAPAVAALDWLNATLPGLASVMAFELHGALPETGIITSEPGLPRLLENNSSPLIRAFRFLNFVARFIFKEFLGGCLHTHGGLLLGLFLRSF